MAFCCWDQVSLKIYLTSCIGKDNPATEYTETFEKSLIKLFFSVISVAKKTFARDLLKENGDKWHADV
jgi:hypothetical protein